MGETNPSSQKWLRTKTALLAAVVGAVAAAGTASFTGAVSKSAEIYRGVEATGTTIFPADPVSGDYVVVGGVRYRVYRTTDDGGVPDGGGVNCTADACSNSVNCASTFAAAINAYPSVKVVVGIDGGVGYVGSKDAGMAANVPIAWRLQTRTTNTVTTTVTNTDTDSQTSTGTATATGTTTTSVTSAGTSTGMSGGSDPLVRGGPTVGIVANDFDPSVSGLTAPLGSTARTVDGASAWLKTGTASTGWVAVGSL